VVGSKGRNPTYDPTAEIRKGGDMMIQTPKFKVGESYTIQKHVTETDTALNYGSGQLENLFATPSLVAMMIEASARLLDQQLPEGFISVGKSVHADHRKPTTLGETVTVKVTIDESTGNMVKLSMEAFDEVGPIGTGEHVRFVVNKKSLLGRANQREEALQSHDF